MAHIQNKRLFKAIEKKKKSLTCNLYCSQNTEEDLIEMRSFGAFLWGHY